jgi:hypothetical protein
MSAVRASLLRPRAQGRPLAQAVPARRRTLPWHRPIVVKEIARHARVAFRRVQIIPECLRLLPPDNAINLKEPRIMAILCAAYDPALLRPVLAATFTLGDPMHHGRQRVLLHDDHRSRVHRLEDGVTLPGL